MGCAKSSNATAPLEYTVYPKGILTVELKDAILFRDTSVVLKMDPYIILKIGDQVLKSLIQKSQGTNPIFHETFTFHINSDKIHTGRCLELQMWDKNIVTDRSIGFGIIDLDGIILNKMVSYNMKCHLSHDMEQAGWVKTVISFKEDYKGKLLVKPISAKLTRKVGMGEMPCAVRITIGEDVAVSKVSMDTKQSSPVWEQALLLNLLNSLNKGKLQVVRQKGDSYDLIGEADLDLEKLSSQNQTQHDIELKYKDTYAGNIKFSSFALSPMDYQKYKEVQPVAVKKPEEVEPNPQQSIINKLKESELKSPQKQREESKQGTNQRINSPEAVKVRESQVSNQNHQE